MLEVRVRHCMTTNLCLLVRAFCADFNGDGKLDLAGSGLNAASVMINNGDGTFRPKTDFQVGVQTQDVAAGDFNGDGRTDLVVTAKQPAS